MEQTSNAQVGEVQEIVEALAKAGITTSFVFGPCGAKGLLWSVDVLTGECESFAKPYAALSVRQAAEIARHECEKRGWMPLS